LSPLPFIEEIREAVRIIIEPIIDDPNASPPKGDTAEWNVEKIRAHDVWNMTGINGTGIVVASIDTGVRRTHEALRDNHRVEYGWYDPYNGTEVPTDENGHGTHTTGTIVGQKGVGVAPGASWIACKGCNNDGCTEAALIKCGQWVACPTDPKGNNPDCTKAPDVSSNSWGGGSNSQFYNKVIEAWRAMDIIPVFALGNSGPLCSTSSSPGDQPNVISVGSTNVDDKVSRFSSRGPATNGLEKPEVSAPGEKVKSAYFKADDSYAVLSGTSMATPATAGTVVLMLAKNKTIKFDDVMNIITTSAHRPQITRLVGQQCGNDIIQPWPNNGFGHGRIDAYEAVQKVA